MTDSKQESGPMKPDFQNDDGSVSDVAARNFMRKQQELANVSPLHRAPQDDSAGTAQHAEENSASHLHSDGGTTLAPEANSVRELAGLTAEQVKEQDKAVEDGVKAAEKHRDEKRKEQDKKAKDEKAEAKKTDK